MTDIEKIVDKYPELEFYFIEVPNPAYNGEINGNCVYINELQPDIVKLQAMLHEASHFENDCSNLSDSKQKATLQAEKWANREAIMNYKIMFG